MLKKMMLILVTLNSCYCNDSQNSRAVINPDANPAVIKYYYIKLLVVDFVKPGDSSVFASDVKELVNPTDAALDSATDGYEAIMQWYASPTKLKVINKKWLLFDTDSAASHDKWKNGNRF